MLYGKRRRIDGTLLSQRIRRISNIGILNTLTPRQFQDAIDKGDTLLSGK